MIPETEELPRVMDEIAQAVGASTTLLTLHPEDESEPPRLIYADVGARLSDADIAAVQRALTGEPVHGDTHVWIDPTDAGLDYTIMAMPVQRVEGHSRLVISALFQQPTEAVRQAATNIYVERRPFAVGYFRLWQMDRTRVSRIKALETALDYTELGIILLDRERRICFLNRTAAKLIEQGDAIRDQHARLIAVNANDHLRLDVALDHVMETARAGKATRRAPLLMLSRRSAGPLIISVLPADTQANEPSDVAAIVYLIDPSVEIGRLLDPVCKLYRLTPVETQLVGLLASGETLAGASSVMRIKLETARGYLKQIFMKTGLNRQVDLVRTMLASTPRISQDIVFESLG